jgi:hypothetical protein
VKQKSASGSALPSASQASTASAPDALFQPAHRRGLLAGGRADRGDAPGARAEEEARHVVRRLDAVDEHPVDDLLLDLADHHDGRQRLGAHDGAPREEHGVEDQAVDQVLPRAGHEVALAVGPRARLLHLDAVAGLVRDLHEVVRELRGVRGAEVGQRDRDDSRAPVAQAARGEVRHVVEVGDGPLDALARGGAHGDAAGDHVRHGLRGDPGARGDVLDCRAHGPPRVRPAAASAAGGALRI